MFIRIFYFVLWVLPMSVSIYYSCMFFKTNVSGEAITLGKIDFLFLWLAWCFIATSVSKYRSLDRLEKHHERLITYLEKLNERVKTNLRRQVKIREQLERELKNEQQNK